MPENNIAAMVETFARQISEAVASATLDRIQAAIAGAVGAPPNRGPGRIAKAVAGVAPVAGKKTRPKQICPVPGCRNIAAPVFGMVCKDHKNVAKSKIKKYRAERGGNSSPASAAKPAAAKKVLSPKAARARKLQGKYMGALKSLKGADRDRVKRTAKEEGVAEAVKLAMTLKKPQ